MLLALLSFPIPILLAILFGFRAGKSNPQTRVEFARTGLFYGAWALMLIYVWHGLWIASVVPAHWYDTARSALFWTFGTGAIWLPVFGITYVWRAMRARKTG